MRWRTLPRRVVIAGAALLLSVACGRAQQPAGTQPVHLGVASCAGGNCHGASEPLPGSRVLNNEYITWSTRDKHRDAYKALSSPQAVRMARALGLADAVHQKICLDCHTDNVPPEQRGQLFHLADGVGCEACHGGASNWLGIHISGAGHAANLRHGLYPAEQPLARAEMCLGCHFGDNERFVDHRMMGAGHPRLPFELDTFTEIEPAHFDNAALERSFGVSNLQVWATGQAVALAKRMDVLLDADRARHGIFPEFALFDCQSCHHLMDPAHAPRPSWTGLDPGTPRLNDANALMLQVAAARVAPATARDLRDHVLALHRAVTGDWGAVAGEAAAVRRAAQALVPLLSSHRFGRDDLRALAVAVIAVAEPRKNLEFAAAEQATMALASIAAGLRSAGGATDVQQRAIGAALEELYAAFPANGALQPTAFAKGLADFKRAFER